MTQENSAWAGASIGLTKRFFSPNFHPASTLFLIMLLSTGSGCGQMLSQWVSNGHKLGPDHVTPHARIACDWHEFSSPFRIDGQHSVDDGHWWESFGDPEIGRIVQATNRSNLTIAAAIHRVEQAQWQQRIAAGNLFPQQQEFFSEFQRIQNSQNGDQLGIGGLGQTFDFYQLGFNASWELDLWGRLKRQVESATANSEASMEDERDVRLSITAQAVNSYLQIRAIQERLEIAYRSIKAQTKSVELAKARFEDGLSSKLDLRQAESSLAIAKSTVPPLERTLIQTNNQLCLLLGIPPRDLTEEMGVGSLPTVPSYVIAGIPADLIRRRPDIRKAERQVASQRALIGVAQAELFPTFSLRGTINWQSFRFSNLFESASNAGAIIPGIRWNILNYGRLLSNVHFQEAKVQEAIINYRQTILTANTEVENSLADFVKEKQRSTDISAAIEATRNAIEIANDQFLEGDTDFDRVNNLRKQLTEQLEARTIAKLASAVALVNFYKAMGGGWSTECGPNEFDAPSICHTQLPQNLGPAPIDHQFTEVEPRYGRSEFPLEPKTLQRNTHSSRPSKILQTGKNLENRNHELAIYRTERRPSLTGQPIKKPQLPNRHAFYHQSLEEEPRPVQHSNKWPRPNRQNFQKVPRRILPMDRPVHQDQMESQPPIPKPTLPTSQKYWHQY